MTVRPEILLLVLAMGAVTVVPRVLPLALLNRVTLPGWAATWLGYVPVAVIAALLAVETLLVDGRLPRTFVAVPIVPVAVVAVVAWWRRSLIASVTAGVVTAALLRLL